VLLRELTGGIPPYTCRVILLDDPAGFGHRVTAGGRVVEHVLTRLADFEDAVAAKVAEGFAETEPSLTRRVFTTADRFWIVTLDGDTVRTQSGRIRVDWRKSGPARGKEFRDRDRAVAAYHRAVADKREEGYQERYARPVPIADAPSSARKPGKRKAR
jgi:predicted DNA-binding WGR domain protein